MISPWGFSMGGRNVFIGVVTLETKLVYPVSTVKQEFCLLIAAWLFAAAVPYLLLAHGGLNHRVRSDQLKNQQPPRSTQFAVQRRRHSRMLGECSAVPGLPQNPPSPITMRNGACLSTMTGCFSSFSSSKARRRG